jgi:cytoskeletal protein RodZ
VLVLQPLVDKCLRLMIQNDQKGGTLMQSRSVVTAFALGFGLAFGTAALAQTTTNTSTTEKPSGEKSTSSSTNDPASGQSVSKSTTSNPVTGQSSASTTAQRSDGTKTTETTEKK